MDQRRFRKILSRAVALPLGLALFLGAVMLTEVLYLLWVQRWVQHTDQVIENTYELERLLVDLETGLRGYLLTDDPAFLAPHEAARPRVFQALDRLEQMVASKSEQEARVERTHEHLQRWLEYAETIIHAPEERRDVLEEVRRGRGKQLMDAMRADLESMIATQRQLRQQRLRASNVAAWIVLISAAGLTALLGGLLALLTRRRLIDVAARYGESLNTIERQTEALRQSEDQYRRLVELSPEGIFVQAEGKIVYANKAFTAMLGASPPDELIGRNVLDLVHPDYREVVTKRIRVVRDEQHDVPLLEERMLRLDGREVWVEVAATPFRYHDTPGAQVVVRNITERKASEEALRHSETSLTKAQQIAHLGNWGYEISSGRVTWSDEMYRIFGVENDTFEPSFERFVGALHPDDRERVVNTIGEARASKQQYQQDYRIVRPDGTIRAVASLGEVVRDGTGQAVTLFGTLLDITERKRAEEQLRQLNETLEQRVAQRTGELRDAVDDLRAFSYTISHDLRTPLRGLQTFARSLLEEHAQQLDEKGTEYARRIVASAARMDRLTEEILEYSQISLRQPLPQRISIVLLLHDLIGQLQRDPEFAAARVSITEPLPWVLAHRATLATVLSNLLTNAARFVAPGTTAQIVVSGEDRGDFARIWVIDNGIGIAPEHHELIFNVFERLDPQTTVAGMGLGLAIVRRGVERMGGRVGVESELGRSSRFWIELPKDPQSP